MTRNLTKRTSISVNAFDYWLTCKSYWRYREWVNWLLRYWKFIAAWLNLSVSLHSLPFAHNNKSQMSLKITLLVWRIFLQALTACLSLNQRQSHQTMLQLSSYKNWSQSGKESESQDTHNLSSDNFNALMNHIKLKYNKWAFHECKEWELHSWVVDALWTS